MSRFSLKVSVDLIIKIINQRHNLAQNLTKLFKVVNHNLFCIFLGGITFPEKTHLKNAKQYAEHRSIIVLRKVGSDIMQCLTPPRVQQAPLL